MISSFRNFAKTKFAGLLVFIMIIPFVFWGMGSMFSSGNTNTIAKINKENISTQEFIDYLNKSGIPQKTIRENLNKDIIEELLSGLVSTTLLDLEIKDYNLIISENTLLKKIKTNKNFHENDGSLSKDDAFHEIVSSWEQAGTGGTAAASGALGRGEQRPEQLQQLRQLQQLHQLHQLQHPQQL